MLAVHVIPRTARDVIVGAEGGGIRVKLRAPPLDDKANAALIKFLAARLGIARAQIEIHRGAKSRHKLVRIRGVSAEKIFALAK